ncbi:hypothetical protein pEaSNUABM29_00099 [Erwinia phage pEa_SNUABM_29]|nr:hypothetical protein pEaSNUABM29_00099 [Erwinia phage pEa_SNUABM_29]
MLQAKKKGDTKFVPIEQEVPILNQSQDGVKESTNIVTVPTRTTVTDFDRIPKQYLMQYNDGSDWSVDFFNSLLGRNDPKTMFDTKIDAPTQQFQKINKLLLRVTSALERSQADDNKTFEITGASTLVSSIAPNEGNFFVTTLGDNRYGLFNVTSVTRMSNNKVATYQIRYTLLYEVTPEMAETIRRCTVRELYYVRERAWTGGDTLLTPKEYRSFLQLGDRIKEIETTYVRRFYDTSLETLAYPRDWKLEGLKAGGYYDVFLAMFVKSIGLRTVGKDIRIYPHPPKPVQDIETLFGVILQQQPELLPYVEKDSSPLNTRTFRTMQTRNTIAWSQFTVTRFFTSQVYQLSSTEAEWPEFTTFEPQMFESYQGNGGDDMVAFAPLTYKPYLLSESFYNGSYASVLEHCLWLYLHKQPVPSDTASKLAELVLALPKDCQFYYVPLVYVVLKYAR